jgi:hypothetical protein
MTARCTECNFIVSIREDQTAMPHGWLASGKCPGTGRMTENPNRQTT